MVAPRHRSNVKFRVSCQDGSRSHFSGLGLFTVPCTMTLLPPAASTHHIPLLSNAHKSPGSWGRWTWQHFTSGRRISENHYPILSLEEVWHDHKTKAVKVTCHQSTALLKGKQRQPHAPHIQRASQFLCINYDSEVTLVPAASAKLQHSRGSVFPNLSTGLSTPPIQTLASQSMFCPLYMDAMPYVLHLLVPGHSGRDEALSCRTAVEASSALGKKYGIPHRKEHITCSFKNNYPSFLIESS